MRYKMEKCGFIDEEQFKKMDAEVKKEVDAAIKFAEKSKEPPLHSLYEDVLV